MRRTPAEKIAFTIIDRWLDYRIRTTAVPGLQLCVRRHGQIIFSKAYGQANTVKKIGLHNQARSTPWLAQQNVYGLRLATTGSGGRAAPGRQTGSSYS